METMNLYGSRQWLSDIDQILKTLPELPELDGKSIMITGAGGLICSALVDILFRYNDKNSKSIHIYAAGRCFEEMVFRFGNKVYRDDFTFVLYDALKSDNNLNFFCNYIIHGASNAFPSKIIKEPVETMISNFNAIKYLLDYGKENKVERILYISSSEVYGMKKENAPYHETEYGYIDLLNPRNAYSMGKRAAETLCVSYTAEYGVKTIIVRPGHIYGPTASSYDNRIASAWAYAAAHGDDIIMKSDGSQLRSYCYCLDCASAILKVLIKGKDACAYNISNADSIITIGSMADLLAKAAGVKVIQEEATDEESKGFNPMSNSSLDSTNLYNLGWKGIFDAGTGFSHTVSILKEIL